MKTMRYTLEILDKMIEYEIKTIPIRWEKVDKAYRLIVEERLKRAGYEFVKEEKGVRTYTLKEEKTA